MEGLQSKVNLWFRENGRKYLDRKLCIALGNGRILILVEERRKMMKEK